MSKLKIKATAEAVAILLGFFIFGIIVSLFFDEVTAELFRIYILEWGAFPMLCAITGAVVSSKNGFLPLYGFFSGMLFAPFMLMFFEVNWGLCFACVLFGILGSLFGHWLFLKEVKRIEEGKPEKHRKSIIFSMFDRYDTKKYK